MSTKDPTVRIPTPQRSDETEAWRIVLTTSSHPAIMPRVLKKMDAARYSVRNVHYEACRDCDTASLELELPGPGINARTAAKELGALDGISEVKVFRA